MSKSKPKLITVDSSNGKQLLIKSDLFNNYHLAYMTARLAEGVMERIREIPN